MTLEQLRIFVEVAECQHLTRAAGALHLTPSAVSASIRVLEERYDTPLFHRVGRRIETSEAGRLFLVEARATLAAARAAELTLLELAGLKRGTLAIFASQTIASYWLPPLMVRFRALYPQIALALTVGNTEKVAQAVSSGAADLGFVEGHVDAPDLVAETVGRDRIAAVAAPGHPWADGRVVAPRDCLDVQWVLREKGSGTRSALEEWLQAGGIDARQLEVALALPSNEAVRAALLAGPFVTVVSELVVAAQLQAGTLVRANAALPPRDFYLLRHGARYQSRAARAMTAMIGEDQASRGAL